MAQLVNVQVARQSWHKPSCPCFSDFNAKCGCGHWSEDLPKELRIEDYQQVAAIVGAGKADCGCWYHAEEGIPCFHDLAVVAEKLGAIPRIVETKT